MAKPMTKQSSLLLAGLLALSTVATPAFAQASLLVWPIDPVIEANRGAGALWLENKGKTDVVVQVRVFAWDQSTGDDTYTDQSLVVPSPPMAKIAPGARQMVRLTSVPATRSGAETAYRIVVDEIPARLPAPPSGSEATPAKAGVRFQMRYSIPLFVYSGRKPAALAKDGDAGLRCTLGTREGRKVVTIHNPGAFHSRLVDLQLVGGTAVTDMPDGQLNYVLPGATMVWPLPDGATARGTVSAMINGNAARVALPACAQE